MGAGFDDPETNRAWAEREGFAYELWTDETRVLAMHYGAARSETQAWADRVTVLLDADGELLLEYRPGADLSTHPLDVLEDCQALFGD